MVLSDSVLLNTGHSIPLVGLGTYKVLGDQVSPVVDAALRAGYRLFDTAKVYNNEPELGAALEEHLPRHNLSRSDVFITTKIIPSSENTSSSARKDIEESLKNLRTSYIDLVLVHYPKSNDRQNNDPLNKQNRKEAYLELEKCKNEGLIRSIGVSNYEPHHIEEIPDYSQTIPALNQVEFHPHLTRNELRAYCKEKGIFFQAFTSLGRQHPDLIEDEDIVSIAKKHDISPQLVLLSWAVSIGVGIIPKSSSPSRVVDNFRVVSIKLSDEECLLLEAKNRNKNYTRCDGWNVV